MFYPIMHHYCHVIRLFVCHVCDAVRFRAREGQCRGLEVVGYHRVPYYRRHFLYSLVQPLLVLDVSFSENTATAAALISLIHTVLSLLGTNEYVRVIALDFSKAFDTVPHSELFDKLSKMNLPDAVYNWIQDFYSDRTHCTRYGGDISQLASILASVVQGSGLGPASFIVTTADLQPVHSGNSILKYHISRRVGCQRGHM